MSKKKRLTNTISKVSKDVYPKGIGISDSEMIDYLLDICIEHAKRISALENPKTN